MSMMHDLHELKQVIMYPMTLLVEDTRVYSSAWSNFPKTITAVKPTNQLKHIYSCSRMPWIVNLGYAYNVMSTTFESHLPGIQQNFLWSPYQNLDVDSFVVTQKV